MKTPKLRKIASFSEYQAEFSLAHELPYWEFLPDCVVLADGSLVTGLSLKGIAIDTWDTERVNQLALDVRSALNSLPDGYELSFYQEVTSDLNPLIDEHLKLKGKNSLIEWVGGSRGAALKRDRERELLLKCEISLFICKRFEASSGKGRSFLKSFFSKPASFSEVTKETHERSLKELLQVTAGIHASLESLGLGVQRIPSEEALRLAYRFINPSRHETVGVPNISDAHRTQEFSPKEIEKVPALALPSPREQLVFSDVIQGYDSFYVDGYYHRVISLKNLPEFTHAAMISRISQLPFPYSLQVHIKVPEQSKELSQLQAKRRMAHSMSISHGGRATDLESEAKLQSAEELLREIINTGQKIFYFQTTLLVRAKSQDEIDSKSRTILTKLRELNGCEGMAETVAAFKTWKTCLPLGNTAMVRPKRIKTDNLADFVPIYAPYDGKTHEGARPVCLFRNRALGLTQYDPFDSKLPNYNALVTGSSGSGKSFLNNLVLFQYLTQDPLVFIIDIGGSYKKLCEFLNGQYIEIAPTRENEKVPCINPMALTPGNFEPSPQKVKFLLSLLENLLTDEDGDKLPKLDKSLLEETVLETYRKCAGDGTSPRLSDLSALLSKSEHGSLKNFSRMLYPWTGDRPYGKFLDAPSSLDLTQDFVVFDLKGLSSYPDLQAAMILILTDFILGKVENTKGKVKRILMDECWELLKSRGSQRFMEYCVRTLRKTGSGITFITQGLEEIVQSPIGAAILSNTATKFILMQRGDLKPIREILKLNDQEITLIASLRQSKGRYSEAFLMANDARTVIQAHPTPVEYWLASSDAADNQLLEEARAKNPDKSLAEHIHDLSISYPFGAAAGIRKS